MVTCDVTALARRVVLAAREAIEKGTGIPAERVMISATHTHTPFAPGISGLDRSVTPEDERYAASFMDNLVGEWDAIVMARFHNRGELNTFVKKVLDHENVDRAYTQVVLNVTMDEKRVLV